MDRFRSHAALPRRAAIYPAREMQMKLEHLDPEPTWKDYLIEFSGFIGMILLGLAFVVLGMLI